MGALMIVTCPTPQRAPTLDRLHALGAQFEVLYLHARATHHGWGDIPLNHPHTIIESKAEAAKYAMRRVLSGQITTVVAFGYREAGQIGALIAARAKALPVITRSDANVDSLQFQSRLRQMTRSLLMHLLLPKTTLVWSIGSKNEAYWHRQRGLTRFTRIPYEVPRLPGNEPPTDRRSNPEHLLRVLYVGRLVTIKRVGDIIKAVRHPVMSDSRWSLTLVGDGPQRPALERLSAGDPRITFTGSVAYDTLADYYKTSDVLVLPSEEEPWGLIVNEALGFGVRVVASEAVGSAHDLLDGNNGAIYPVGDIAALAGQLQKSRGFPVQAARRAATETAALMARSLAEVSASRGSPRQDAHAPAR